MKIPLLALGALSLLGCTAASQGGDGADPSATSVQENGMTNGSDGGNVAVPRPAEPKPGDIQPSPWQPPAEVDPVPPPVEGGETKEPTGPGSG